MDQAIFDASVNPNSPIYQELQKRPSYLNPAYDSDENKNYLRRMGLMLQKPAEAKSWAQVFGNMAQAGVGAFLARQAAEFDQAKQGAIKQTSQWAEPNAGPAQGGDAGTSAPASAPQAEASDSGKSLASFYADKLGPAGAAGLVGGFGHETGGTYSSAIQGDNGTSLGLAQWHDTGKPGGNRKTDNLVAYARKYGKSPTDPDVQRQYPLVEMGLAGDPSDPGYSTERKAGQALIAAKTPQEATAAALMYERPQNWTPGHPERAAGYASRLAYANALMGGQRGGQGGARAYADAGGSQGGGGPQWPAQKPQTQVPLSGGALPQPNHPSTIGGQPLPQRPAGPVMAQNAPQRFVPGGAPIQGTRPYADIMAIPGHPAQENIMEQNKPAALTGPLGEVQINRPNITPSGKEVIPGAASTTTTVSPNSISIPSVTRLPQGQPPQTVVGPANANDLQGIVRQAAPAMEDLQGVGARGAEALTDAEAIGQYKLLGETAKGNLAKLEAFRALGQGITSGISAQIKAKLAQYGVPLPADNEQGRLQAYQFMAHMLLPPNAPQGIRENIPVLSASPETRNQVTDFIENQARYLSDIGDIARDNEKTPDIRERRRKIGEVKPPTFGQPGAPAGGAPAPAGASAAQGGGPSSPKTAEEYALIPKGTQYHHPDDPPGKLRTKR